MTNMEMLTLFGLAMLALALAAILIDWISRPNRRRFVPKIYRYPTELAPPPDPTRTAWSDANFVVPDSPPLGEPVHFSDGTTEWSDSAFLIPEAPENPVVRTLGLDQEVADNPEADLAEPELAQPKFETVLDEPEPELAQPEPEPAPATVEPEVVKSKPERKIHPVPERSEGWSPGQFVFNLTRSGGEPSNDVVSRRFWKNVSMSDHRGAFGKGNETRVAEGKSPVRINPRTGKQELMKLVGTKFHDQAGQPPQPTWPGDAVDPFGES